MAGYRESCFDPMAGGAYGPPVRPFNWVQWCGVALMLVGIGIMIAYLAGQFGLIRQPLHSATPGAGFLLIATVLINSRRAEISPEQLATNRRRALIGALIGLVACGVGLALILILKGA